MILQIFNKLLVIFLLSRAIKGLDEAGFIDFLIQPVNKIKNVKLATLFWFIIGGLISAFFLDLTTALILLPFQVLYLQKAGIEKNKEIMLIALCFGICAGGDLTMYGGGDNLVAVGMYEGFTHAMWMRYMLPMTLITMIGIAAILMLFIQDEEIREVEIQKRKVNWVAVLCLLVTIVLVFKGFLAGAAIITFLAFILLAKPSLLIEDIPYRLMAIWTIAFLFGKLSGYLVLNSLTIQTNENVAFLILCGITSMATIFCTNTATAACVMGIYFALFPLSPITFCLLLKCINVGYLTIFHNTCLAAGSGYGISQKKLFKIGLPVTIYQLLIISIFLFFWI